MTKPFQIRNEEIVREIRELAALEGKPMTQMVGELVHERLLKVRPPEDRVARRKELDALLAEIWAMPKTGPILTDDDFYDESGFPK